METKKFKINKPESVKSGKKLSLSSILSKAGFTVAGGAAGAAFAAAHAKPKPEEPAKEEVEDVQPGTPVSEEQETHVQEENTTNAEENITEPQPIDNNTMTQNNNQPSNPEEEIDPELVAQTIAQEVDENDIDADNVFTPDGYDYAYMPDGTRQLVIVGHTPDGEQYVLADPDGDGVYNGIFDINGNFVAEIDGFSISDLMDMIDTTGGYIANIDEPWGDGTTTPETIITSEEEIAEIEEVNEEELLAQLTEEEVEEVPSEEKVIEEPELEFEEDDEENFDEEQDEGSYVGSLDEDEA